jgi:hypothetical protein
MSAAIQPGSPEWLRKEADYMDGALGLRRGFLTGLRAAAERIEKAEAERDRLREALDRADVIATCEREGRRSDWVEWRGWIHPGECVLVVNRTAMDAARKDTQ